ncbi:hypothetical protein BN7_1733 [Wickerhamomyces ciferrii]|uniref:Transmembrane protein n=1 Tax=Wickerhamomyces ciferrii (strain ATCC 14091 / BCRC 22168 / CBS 111 / JCM 3599 / NBRC 0793 / NRRL Y-1031 F-60-10) TaxID=1206466 RepID=K0KLD8_WICCF|nr:uncharacterized protein BN7_1733 [Wickerhamomyces ciferrii]CCH42189.1 hypothetical protein BN7_1733 [Wickerhamomyces ciferrii]
MKSPTKYEKNIKNIIGKFDKISSPKKKPLSFIQEILPKDQESHISSKDIKHDQSIQQEQVQLSQDPILQSSPNVKVLSQEQYVQQIESYIKSGYLESIIDSEENKNDLEPKLIDFDSAPKDEDSNSKHESIKYDIKPEMKDNENKLETINFPKDQDQTIDDPEATKSVIFSQIAESNPIVQSTNLETITINDYEFDEEDHSPDYVYRPLAEPQEEYDEAFGKFTFKERYKNIQTDDIELLEDDEEEESSSYNDSPTSHQSLFGSTLQQDQDEEDSLIKDAMHHERPFFKSIIYIDVFTGYIGLGLFVLMIILRFLYMWQQREEVSFLRSEVKELSGVVKALEMKFSKLDVTASSINIPINFAQ